MADSQSTRKRSILLVEDNPADALIARRALARGPVPVDVYHVADGEAALAFLRGSREGGAAPRPDLVLLDLNLPGRDGHEVLGEIRADPALATVPVLVLSSSTSEDDVRSCYALHANAFLSKPLGFHEFVELVVQVERFWFEVARIPRPGDTDGGPPR